MATTPNFGWITPDDTSFVKDGAQAIRSVSNSIDSTVASVGVRAFATVAARTAAIPSPVTGMLAYVGDVAGDSGTNATIADVPQIQAYTGASWQNLDGLTLISSATIGTAVSSVTISGVFSAVYDAYKVVITGGASSVGVNLFFRLSGATANYRNAFNFNSYNTTVAAFGAPTGAHFFDAGFASTNYIDMNLDVRNPFLTKPTLFNAYVSGTTTAGVCVGGHNAITSHTGLIVTHGTGTMTGGTIAVYGYRKV